ncbi:NAD-dependent epimerase/dehydratase family protein [Legionella sp.]|uniref:NAD-dependent epimerase/dehydratase family protein n=1 Tax=Legionella sp. TaxID=459 RepID=UPI003C825142
MKLLANDLDYILLHTNPLWENLRNQRIFITGGTGFFGCWLLESLVSANKLFKLNTTAVILTRSPEQFKKKCPHLFLEPCLIVHKGDVQNFKFPEGEFSYIIHAATDTDSEYPELMFQTITQGTVHTLDFARQAGVRSILLTSSGAIYGRQPANISHLFENSSSYSLNEASAYARGKRKAEELCDYYATQFNLNIKIARCFAFVGPHLPLESHFAIGNFIRDGLQQKTIIVNSDGSSYRSYLYAADLAIWLWTILFRGKTMRPYNVGSDEALNIRELAHQVANNFRPSPSINIKQIPSTRPPERYVPDISRAREELGLVPGINLQQAIQKTINWYSHLDWNNTN